MERGRAEGAEGPVFVLLSAAAGLKIPPTCPEQASRGEHASHQLHAHCTQGSMNDAWCQTARERMQVTGFDELSEDEYSVLSRGITQDSKTGANGTGEVRGARHTLPLNDIGWTLRRQKTLNDKAVEL